MSRVLGLIAGLALLAASLGAVAAQDDTPEAAEAPEIGATLAATLQDTEGRTVGVALLAGGEDGEDEGVAIIVGAVGLAPGPHGIHVHETGVCDPAGDRAFASAGGHYNPTDAEHGDHAGDLGNITSEEDGTATLRETTDNFGLDELQDEDGTAIVIHAEEDENDPAGESFGARIACGVLAAPAGAATGTVPADAEATAGTGAMTGAATTPAAGATEAETPVTDAETPVADVETPVADVETPVADVETPVADVETPAAGAEETPAP